MEFMTDVYFPDGKKKQKKPYLYFLNQKLDSKL